MKTYIAKTGVTVTTCNADSLGTAEDFPTVFHYMHWSYGSWLRKIIRDVRGK